MGKVTFTNVLSVCFFTCFQSEKQIFGIQHGRTELVLTVLFLNYLLIFSEVGTLNGESYLHKCTFSLFYYLFSIRKIHFCYSLWWIIICVNSFIIIYLLFGSAVGTLNGESYLHKCTFSLFYYLFSIRKIDFCYSAWKNRTCVNSFISKLFIICQ